MPVKVDGKYETKTFSKKEDIFEVIDLLIKETKEINAKGKEFDLALSVKSQLPFFCCINKVLDSEMHKDIKMYKSFIRQIENTLFIYIIFILYEILFISYYFS